MGLHMTVKNLGSYLTAGRVGEGKAGFGGWEAVKSAFRKIQSEIYSG